MTREAEESAGGSSLRELAPGSRQSAVKVAKQGVGGEFLAGTGRRERELSSSCGW